MAEGLALYGHPFSSYTWKALIALYAIDEPFDFRILDVGEPIHPEHGAFVASVSPVGKFPVLADGDRVVFEATSIIEYLAVHFPSEPPLIPRDPDAALTERTMDRVFDNYVMNPMQEIVGAHIRSPGMPDPPTIGRARDMLDKAYRWIDGWLADNPRGDGIGLIECSAAPSLFYADWVYPIPMELDRLRQWRAHLLGLPPVARCVEAARPFRHFFPPGAPDRD